MKKAFHLIPLLVLIIACGTSSVITSSWRAPEKVTASFRKVIVLGLIKESDRSLREEMEQYLAASLREKGQDAIFACDIYSPKEFDRMTEEQALERLQNSGVDGVLTVVLLDKTKERYYVPGHVQYTPYMVYYNRFWGYSRALYGRIYSPGYYTTDTKYFWETNLYDLMSDKLLYSAQSQSFDPASSSAMGKQHARLILDDISAKNIIAFSSKPTKAP
jgi:hypothetical protein